MADTLEKFVREWGFCPHVDEGMCETCQNDPSQRSYSTSDMLALNHERQVAIFNFCWCECNDIPHVSIKTYEDCPSVKCADCNDTLDMDEYGEGGHIYPDGSVLCATCEAIRYVE